MTFKKFYSFTRTLLFLLLLPGSLGLRDVRMVIPEAAERGKPVVIRCLYDLENEDLYQVKWYRGYREFCRYAPKEKPLLKIFPIPGIEVDPEGSDAKQLTISAVTRTAQGSYTCEVSTDTSPILSARLQRYMYVVDLPISYPELIWAHQLYKPGMKIKAECISYNSMPPANLSFFINSEPALSQYVWKRVSGGKNGSLWTSYGTLKFIVKKHHLITSKIRIRCDASIYDVYYKTHEKTALAETMTTIAPVTMTQCCTLYPTHRIPANNSSWNQDFLCVLFLSFIVFGQHLVA